MKRLKITLTGHVTHWASRSFIIEVPDDANVKTLDQRVLETLADEAKVGWEFDSEGFVQATDHSIEEIDSEGDQPVIPLSEAPLIQELAVPENKQSGPA